MGSSLKANTAQGTRSSEPYVTGDETPNVDLATAAVRVTKSWPRRVGPIRSFTFESDFFSTPCHEIEVEGRKIRYVDSNRSAYARLVTLFTKEPTTTPWLESFEPDETFVDIGANIGMYSIYAAAFSGCRVFAFEPESLNYAELNKNIFVNGLHGRVSAFSLALSDEAKIDYLNLGTFGVSFSHHDFAENTWVEDMDWGSKWTKKDARLQQGCVSSTLDTLVGCGIVPVPHHIKIDVDGLEHRVLAGCRKTLENPGLKTVLVEVDFRSDHASGIIDMMTALGWMYSMDQLRANREQILSVEMIERLRREKRDGMNYIFFRDDKYGRVFEDFLSHYQVPSSWRHPVPAQNEAQIDSCREAIEQSRVGGPVRRKKRSWSRKLRRSVMKRLAVLQNAMRRRPE